MNLTPIRELKPVWISLKDDYEQRSYWVFSCITNDVQLKQPRIVYYATLRDVLKASRVIMRSHKFELSTSLFKVAMAQRLKLPQVRLNSGVTDWRRSVLRMEGGETCITRIVWAQAITERTIHNGSIRYYVEQLSNRHFAE